MSGTTITKTYADWQVKRAQKQACIDEDNKVIRARNWTPTFIVLRILASLVVSGGLAVGCYFGMKHSFGARSVSGVAIQAASVYAGVQAVGALLFIWGTFGEKRLDKSWDKDYLQSMSTKLRDVKSFQDLEYVLSSDSRGRNDYGSTVVNQQALKNWVDAGLITEELKKTLIEQIVQFKQFKARENQLKYMNRRDAKYSSLKSELESDRLKINQKFAVLKRDIEENTSPPSAYVDPTQPVFTPVRRPIRRSSSVDVGSGPSSSAPFLPRDRGSSGTGAATILTAAVGADMLLHSHGNFAEAFVGASLFMGSSGGGFF